jgi:hypothetical protein
MNSCLLRTSSVTLRACFALLLAAASLSCTKGFDPASKVAGVRVIGSKTDKPYAKPGEEVTVSLLVADERPDRTVPLVVGFIPFSCLNPRDDLYFLCFVPPSAGGAAAIPGAPVAGASPTPAPPASGAGGIEQLKPGQDLTNFLAKGDSYTFRIPDTAVIKRPKLDTDYGLSIVFWVACAGRVVFTGITANAAASLPLQCIVNGEPAPPSDFVFGLSRVYAYKDRTNANPRIQEIRSDGKAVDPSQGLSFDACASEKASDCPERKIDVILAADDQELNNNERDETGKPLGELVWASYFSTVGEFDDEARLIFDPKSGFVGQTEVKFRAQGKPGQSGRMWIVARDNRGGANWVQLPVRLK